MPVETLENPADLQDTPQPKDHTGPPSMKGWMSGLGEIAPTKDDAGKETTAVVGAVSDEQEREQQAAVEASKPAPTKPVDQEEKFPRNAKDWDAFRAARKTEKETLAAEAKAAKEEAATIRRELEEARKAPKAPDDYEDAKKRLAEAEDIIKKVAVTEHPKFKSYFNGKVNQQYELAKTIVGTENAAQIEKILKINDPETRDRQFEEFTSVLSSLQQSRLGAVLNNLTSIEQEKSQAIADSQKTYEDMTKAEKARFESESKARAVAGQKAFDAELAAAQDKDKGLPIFQKREGDSTWNKQVDALVESTKHILANGSQMAPNEAVRAAMYAASFPTLLQWANSQLTTKDGEIAKLTEQVRKLSGAEPVLRQSERPAGNDRPAALKHQAHKNPADATADWTKSIAQDWQK